MAPSSAVLKLFFFFGRKGSRHLAKIGASACTVDRTLGPTPAPPILLVETLLVWEKKNKIAILHDFHQALTSSVAQPSEGRTPFTLHSFSLWHLFKKGMIG